MTQTVKVNFATGTYRNVDGIVLNDDSETLLNGIIDKKGGMRARPGLRYIVSPTGSAAVIHGAYWWSKQNYALVVASGAVYKITKSGSTYSATLLGSGLNPTNQVSFASDGDNVYMANGGSIYYTSGTTLTVMADTDAPTVCTQVIYIDGYLIANNDSNTWKFSDVNNLTSWSALNIASAAGNADFVTVVKNLNRDIFFLGAESLEIWQNNGQTPFERIPGGYLDTGCIAPFSVITTELSLYWLDESRKFVKFNGRTIEPFPSDFDVEIQAFSSVSDCLAHRIEILGQELLVFNFPSQQRTLVCNLSSETWTEWSFWNSPAMADEAWRGNCHAVCPGWGVHIVGDKNNGSVYVLDPEAPYDGTSNQYEIRVGKRTGHLDYGTSKQKQSQEFRVRLKRGVEGVGTSKISIRWRNDNKAWSPWRLINLGPQGDTNLIQIFYRTGIFRARQYEVVASDFTKFVMADAEEDVEIL